MKRSVQEFQKNKLQRARKAAIFGAIAVVSITAAIAQKNEAPSAVVQSFKGHFPNAQKVKWEKEGNNFEAEFQSNKAQQSAVFDNAGTLLETETEIAVNELPKKTIGYVNANYQSEKIKEAAKIMDATGVITFEVEMKGKDLIFDRNGKFIKANSTSR